MERGLERVGKRWWMSFQSASVLFWDVGEAEPLQAGIKV